MISPRALIGAPPQMRGYQEPGIPPVIDPTARVEAFSTVDAGVQDATRVGARSWVMRLVHIGHDAQIGADCELAPGTIIGGHAVLEDGVRCGIGVLVKPFVRVGVDARLGMGAVVTKDVPAGETWVGNPAEEINAARRRRAYTDDRAIWLEWWEERAAEVPCVS